MRPHLVVLLTLLSLVGCGGPALPPLDPPEPLTSFSPELSVDTLWSVELGRGVGRQYLRLAPLVDGDRVYLAAIDGEVAAFNADDGTRLWRRDLAFQINAAPVDGGTAFYLGTENGVSALRKSDGEEIWRKTLNSEVLAAPLAHDNLLIVRSVDGTVSALNRTDGSLVWEVRDVVPSLTLRSQSSPVLDGDSVVVGFADGKLKALAVADGTERWQAEIATPRGRTELERLVDLDAALAVGGGLIFSASYHDRVVASSATSGRAIWSRNIGSFSGLFLAGDTLFMVDNHSDLWALSARSGATIWRQKILHGRKLSAPVGQGKYVLVGDQEGYLHWLSQDDGRLVARARIETWPHLIAGDDVDLEEDTVSDRSVLAWPVVVGDRVYAVDKRGVLNALKVSVKERTGGNPR